MSNATSNALSSLHYALPYLPERFRRVQGTGNQDIKDLDSAIGAPASERQDGITTQANRDNLQSHEHTFDCNRYENEVFNKDNELHNISYINRLFGFEHETGDGFSSLIDGNENDGVDNLSDKSFPSFRKSDQAYDYESLYVTPRGRTRQSGRNSARDDNSNFSFERLLEDPFHVRGEEKDPKGVEICEGLLDLVKDIDEPFVSSKDNIVNDFKDSSSCGCWNDRSPRDSLNSIHDNRETHSEDIWLPERRESLSLFDSGSAWSRLDFLDDGSASDEESQTETFNNSFEVISYIIHTY